MFRIDQAGCNIYSTPAHSRGGSALSKRYAQNAVSAVGMGFIGVSWLLSVYGHALGNRVDEVLDLARLDAPGWTLIRRVDTHCVFHQAATGPA